jgi:hypothetical protein
LVTVLLLDRELSASDLAVVELTGEVGGLAHQVQRLYWLVVVAFPVLTVASIAALYRP